MVGKNACNMGTIDCSVDVTARRIQRQIVMNRKTMALSAIIAVAAGSGSPLAIAQDVENRVPPRILACASEQDIMVRLACYDREVAVLVARPPSPSTPPPVTVFPSAASQADRMALPAETTAGAAVATVPPVHVDSSPEPKTAAPDATGFGYDRESESVTATVVKIRKRPYGELIVSLDNGQIWEQKHVDRRFKLRVGDTVTITRGKVSGYRMSGKANKAIQVTRRK